MGNWLVWFYGKALDGTFSKLHPNQNLFYVWLAVLGISEGEMEADLMVGPVLIRKAAVNHERDQVEIEEEMLAEDQEASA